MYRFIKETYNLTMYGPKINHGSSLSWTIVSFFDIFHKLYTSVYFLNYYHFCKEKIVQGTDYPKLGSTYLYWACHKAGTARTRMVISTCVKHTTIRASVVNTVFPKWISLNSANSVNRNKIQKWCGYQGDHLSTDRYIPNNNSSTK